MILNLFAEGETPEEFRDQLNSSIAAIVSGLNSALIGEVIVYNGAGDYSHSLGVKPSFALIAGSGSVDHIAPDLYYWDDRTVYLPTLSGSGYKEILLLAQL